VWKVGQTQRGGKKVAGAGALSRERAGFRENRKEKGIGAGLRGRGRKRYSVDCKESGDGVPRGSKNKSQSAGRMGRLVAADGRFEFGLGGELGGKLADVRRQRRRDRGVEKESALKKGGIRAGVGKGCLLGK